MNILKCSICIQSELSSMSSMFSLRLFSSQYQFRRYSSSLCRSRHGLGIVSPKNVIKKMITFISTTCVLVAGRSTFSFYSNTELTYIK